MFPTRALLLAFLGASLWGDEATRHNKEKEQNQILGKFPLTGEPYSDANCKKVDVHNGKKTRTTYLMEDCGLKKDGEFCKKCIPGVTPLAHAEVNGNIKDCSNVIYVAFIKCAHEPIGFIEKDWIKQDEQVETGACQAEFASREGSKEVHATFPQDREDAPAETFNATGAAQAPADDEDEEGEEGDEDEEEDGDQPPARPVAAASAKAPNAASGAPAAPAADDDDDDDDVEEGQAGAPSAVGGPSGKETAASAKEEAAPEAAAAANPPPPAANDDDDENGEDEDTEASSARGPPPDDEKIDGKKMCCFCTMADGSGRFAIKKISARGQCAACEPGRQLWQVVLPEEIPGTPNHVLCDAAAEKKLAELGYSPELLAKGAAKKKEKSAASVE
eukprot:TRINITY_DN433_c0_g3_i4.p1 TRINITY_DN433_c0_g3~~TRINITY_DN433_c0_g3_i4.p1  ORF type:complete len:390 (-),score=113.46 TRINITY_DN433_c0_g3_i4:90-1259(-)